LSSSTLTPGTVLWWDGKPWRALNLGETTVTLLSPENHLLDVPIAVFDALITQRKVTIATASRDGEARSAEEHERLPKASPKHLAIATQRYKLLGRALPQGEGATVAPRTLQRWQAQFRTAEVVHGHGFTGLIPRWSNSGNRLPRLSQSTEQLLEKYITDHYETDAPAVQTCRVPAAGTGSQGQQYSRSQLQNDLARASKSAHVINKP
jgi:putative transposase